MAKVKLTDLFLDRKNLEPGVYWDSLKPGFGLRVGTAGKRSWIVQVRILRAGAWKQTKVTLGTYPIKSLAEARAAADQAMIAVQEGRDPRSTKVSQKQELIDKSLNTFGSVRDRFLIEHPKDKGLRPGTVKEYSQALRHEDFKDWELRPIVDIERRDVIELINIVKSRGQIRANRTLQYLKTLMNWAAYQEIIPPHIPVPTDRVKQTKEEILGRFLSRAEIEVLCKVLSDEPLWGPIIKILLLTGQRKNEVAQLVWSELDLTNSRWILPAERAKNHQRHQVHLSLPVIRLLNSLKSGDKFVFTTNGESPVSGFSKLKARLDEKIAEIKKKEGLAGVFESDWTLQALRRTFSTHLGELGFDQELIDLLTNHKRKGVAAHYNFSGRMEDRRKAFDLWAETVASITTKTPELKVV